MNHSTDMFDDMEKHHGDPEQHLEEIEKGVDSHAKHVEGNVLLVDARGDIRLVPTPT
jgi:hypothetical protein